MSSQESKDRAKLYVRLGICSAIVIGLVAVVMISARYRSTQQQSQLLQPSPEELLFQKLREYRYHRQVLIERCVKLQIRREQLLGYQKVGNRDPMVELEILAINSELKRIKELVEGK